MALKETPLVSVVMPAYNHEEYVRSAIDSVLAQSYENLEIIIINDGSTDRTGEVCREIARQDPRIYYYEQANQGAPNTLNRGISLARGRYITILNSDDLFAPNKIERCLDLILQNDSTQFIAGHVELIGSNGKPLRRGGAINWQKRGYQYLAHSGLIPLAMLNENIIATTSNMFFTKELWQAAGRFQPLRYCHDLDFLMAAFRSGPYLFDHQVTHVRYRVHKENTIKEDYANIRIEIAAVLAVSLILDHVNLLGDVDERSVESFKLFLNNKKLSDLVIFLMMNFVKHQSRHHFYQSLHDRKLRSYCQKVMSNHCEPSASL